MSQYALVLIISGFMPFVLSFFPPLKIYSNIRALVLSLGLITLIFGTWDIWAVSRGHWYFNSQSVGKARIVNLPLEEVLFFVVIPFCCIFTWEVIKYFQKKIK